jgi:DNA-directed RNA polymerase subunit M/transcription elongation factor TFIIS
MSPGNPLEQSPETKPICPQCGSDDTAPIPPQPAPPAVDPRRARAKEQPLYRCLTCRHKWKEGEEI